jgi:hypothetical protein
MLECFFFIATGWFMTPVPLTLANQQNVTALAALKNAGINADGETLLALFKKRTLKESERGRVSNLIRQLGSETYRLREQALNELIGIGPAVAEMLQLATKNPDLEISRRAEKALTRIQEKDLPIDVVAAAVRVLAFRRPAGTVETMLAFVPYTDAEGVVADETRTLLTLLAVENGKAHPALRAGLADAQPMSRAAAAEALCRAGLEDQKSEVRKLLADVDPYVRLRTAMALANAGDKEGIPVLIEAMPRLSLVQAWQAEDLLLRLAAGKSPPAVSVGIDDGARAKCRDAWLAWWKQYGTRVDLAQLHERPRLLGYTLVVMLDIGRVMELGAENHVRWQVDNLALPLDAQYLPGDRVLVAEYLASRVTERNLKGDILWEKSDIPGPLVAQRLASGHTFIATDNQLFEIDRAGKTTYKITMSEDEKIMKAAKLPNGEILCLTDAARVVRMDAAGKELYAYTIPLGKRLFGGRLYMLPNGRVLIAHNDENKVIEYDARGKAVWELAVDEPVAALRLPNGNTLVTTMLPQRGAIEFDRNGQEVWSYRSTTRVTRALRR